MRQASIQVPKRSHERRKGMLSGRIFLVTRTSEGNAIERKMLEGHGATVLELPAIKIALPSSWKKFDIAVSELDEFDWILFTSANGVKTFFERLKNYYPQLFMKLKRGAEPKPKFACVGPATRRSLEEIGFECSLQPKEFLTANLGKELASSMNVNGRKILLARAEVANEEISRILRAAGAYLSVVPTYRTLSTGQSLEPELLERITDITLTSPSTVEGLLLSVKPSEIAERQIAVHCIGPVTSIRAKSRGLNVKTVSNIHTVEGLVQTIVKDSRRQKLKS